MPEKMKKWLWLFVILVIIGFLLFLLEPKNKRGNVVKEKKNNYTVKINAIKEGGHIRIGYPEIVGWNLEDKEKEWNLRMMNTAKTIRKDITKQDVYEQNYEILTKTDSFLSVGGTGYVHLYNSPYPTHIMSSYNIDMKSGKTRRLSETEIEQIIKKLLYTNHYKILTKGITLQEIIDQAVLTEDAMKNEDKLRMLLRSFDLTGEDEIPYGVTYWKKGRLHLVFFVPHVLGDVVDVEMKIG